VFWFPTRSCRANSEKWQNALKKLNSLENVTVRPSAVKFNQYPPRLKGYSKGTTAYLKKQDKHKSAVLCPKSLYRQTSCESNQCFICWDNKHVVGYLAHGRQGKQEATIPSQHEMQRREQWKTKFTKLRINV